VRVAEIMTTEVLTVTPETPLKQVAEILARRGISGAPVVDEEMHVLGVVSEADIIVRESRVRQPDALSRMMLRRSNSMATKRAARTAGEAMTLPAITLTPSRRVDVAAALMLDRGINRLPIVDAQGVLVGIVTRADLVEAFVHSDEEIAKEIREDVLMRELWLRPDDFDLTVDGGEVTLAGHLPSDEERELLIRRVALVPGVITVELRETTHV
jgi:CBS domain-containing protein